MDDIALFAFNWFGFDIQDFEYHDDIKFGKLFVKNICSNDSPNHFSSDFFFLVNKYLGSIYDLTILPDNVIKIVFRK